MQVQITKNLVIVLTPQEQGLIMRGLGELKASESRDVLNRMEMHIIQNEKPTPAAEPEGDAPVKQLRPVSHMGQSEAA